MRQVLLLGAVLASPAAATLPDPVRAMIEGAFHDNDPAVIAAVIRVAKETHPEDAAEIDAMSNARLARLAVAQEAQREGASYFDFVHGNLEFGASRSTGNNDSFGAYGSVQLTQASPHWQHSINARVDYLRTNGLTSTDHVTATAQSNYKFKDTRYVFGLAQYERDPIIGYWSRLTLGTGLGWTVLSTPKVKLDLLGGPALRRTDYLNVDPDPLNPDARLTPHAETALAARGSMTFRWQISPTITFTEDAAAYIEHGDSNAVANVGFETPLIGKLKGRLSYNLQYEEDPPAGTRSMDTTSRATVLYSF